MLLGISRGSSGIFGPMWGSDTARSVWRAVAVGPVQACCVSNLCLENNDRRWRKTKDKVNKWGRLVRNTQSPKLGSCPSEGGINHPDQQDHGQAEAGYSMRVEIQSHERKSLIRARVKLTGQLVLVARCVVKLQVADACSRHCYRPI